MHSITLSPLHVEDLQNSSHSSIFEQTPTYEILLIRLPITPLNCDTLGFVFDKNNSYTFKNGTLNKLQDKFFSPHATIDKISDEMLKVSLSLHDDVMDLEQELYENKNSSLFIKSWLKLKTKALSIERIMLRTTVVFAKVIEYYKLEPTFPLNHYNDTLEHLLRIQRNAEHMLSKLDYLYNFHNAKSQDRTNKILQVLTIVSVIFLPLNLAVGFFGMNTQDLPFSQTSSGTLYVTLIIFFLAVMATFLIYMWRKSDK